MVGQYNTELRDFEINGQIIEPGEESLVRINVGRLPSGTRINVNTFVFRSSRPGPTILIMGGVHGDEINGVEIVRRCLDEGVFRNLKCGSVIAIPLLNVYGFINFSREVPDGKDVNRSFPGNLRGSLASRVARVVTKRILPLVDLGIDFHTGGAARYNYPQIRYTRKDEWSLLMAREFAAPFIIAKPVISKSLRKVARDQKIPMIVFEGGEALRLDGFSITKGMQGLQRVLAMHDMLDIDLLKPDYPIIHIEKSTWVRAAHAGLFTWSKPSGWMIHKGEPIGTIGDPYGSRSSKVLATRDGYIIGHNNSPMVNQGDALFHVGYQYSEINKDER